MASGFIEISNDRVFAVRWPAFDEIIRIIIRELKKMDNSENLILFLSAYIPKKQLKAGSELGWGFVDEKTNEIVSRIITLNELSHKDLELFWKAVESGNKQLIEQGKEYSFLQMDIMNDLLKLKNI